MLPTSEGNPSGSMKLISAFGQAETAKLARLPLPLCHDESIVDGTQVNMSVNMCMLTDELDLGVGCLLTGEDREQLLGGAGLSPASQWEASAKSGVGRDGGGEHEKYEVLTAFM